LRALIAELGLHDRVRLLGFQTDARPIYEAIDLFVLSSLREGLPNVVLEAMAMETPVVATRIAGVPRLIQDGENGLLVEPGALDELTRAIARLLDDSDARLKLSAAGRKTVEQRYSFAVRMQKIQSIYDRLLGRNRPVVGTAT
jgi:glycosyltransferase involved in cell wall biosynthesis